MAISIVNISIVIYFVNLFPMNCNKLQRKSDVTSDCNHPELRINFLLTEM